MKTDTLLNYLKNASDPRSSDYLVNVSNGKERNHFTESLLIFFCVFLVKWRDFSLFEDHFSVVARGLTGEPVHASRPRNSPYRHTFRWHIYNTRKPKIPNSPILRHRQCPQGTASRPCYMEPFPDTA